VFIPEVLANARNDIVAAPEQLYYKNQINMLEKYSDSNIELAQKHASLTWGDCSFTLQPNTIAKLTKANRFIDANGNLMKEGKELVLEKMHSNFLVHHLLKLLTDSAHQAIEQQSSIYTWISQSGNKEEVNELTILALILAQIFPNFKVDMYAEITKVKNFTIAQHNNNVQLYFDVVWFLKLQIDQKDPNAYTEDAYICDIFLQLKHDSLTAEFRLIFAHQETCWMMNKSNISSQGLIDDAFAYHINLKNLGAWKAELFKARGLLR
jgi:hypothetical protein